MLMRPNKAETALHDCQCPGVRVTPLAVSVSHNNLTHFITFYAENR